jgi:Na+/H+ antiporter NhaD/arsenite permease-like protein
MEAWIPISFFAMIVAIVALPVYFRSKERAKLHETLRAAYERGQPVDPALIDALARDEKARPSPERDLRIGIILVAVALAMVVLGATISRVEHDEALWILSAAAAFPGFIGLAFLGFWLGKRGQANAELER